MTTKPAFFMGGKFLSLHLAWDARFMLVAEGSLSFKEKTLQPSAKDPESDAIVEHANVVVRHHIVDETNVYVLLTAVGIAQARIHCMGCDLRLAEKASMLMDLSAIVSEHPQTGAPNPTTPDGRDNREPRAFMPPLPCCNGRCRPLIISRCMTLVWTRTLAS
jgi:hypothetical protein